MSKSQHECMTSRDIPSSSSPRSRESRVWEVPASLCSSWYRSDVRVTEEEQNLLMKAELW